MDSPTPTDDRDRIAKWSALGNHDEMPDFTPIYGRHESGGIDVSFVHALRSLSREVLALRDRVEYLEADWNEID